MRVYRDPTFQGGGVSRLSTKFTVKLVDCLLSRDDGCFTDFANIDVKNVYHFCGGL